MEDPARDVEGVIRKLTQTPPSAQRLAVRTYFTPDAEFIHPFCRTGSFEGSRFLIRAIYRWYKIMSPHIDLTVHSVAYDAEHLILYVNISQVFRIWIIPFYKAPVSLTTVLRLRQNRGDKKYYITSQNDLYQVDQFVKFVAWPFGFIFVLIWQVVATLFCLLGAVALWPISWWEEYGDDVKNASTRQVNGVQDAIDAQFVEMPKGSGQLVQAPAASQ